MPKLNDRGITQIFLLLILLTGIIGGLYLVSHPTFFKPKAEGPQSVAPTTSFSFFSDAQGTTIGSQLAVKVLVRSDLAATNLFNAKINFPADILAVDHIDYAGTFIDSWIEQYFDNNSGTISLVGGVPSPGFSTDINSSAGQMAVIYFKVLKVDTPNISFADNSAIYSNADNLNILTNKLPINISIISGESVSSRIFITSTTYDGNLGGLSGADQKCQDRANAVNLTGEWKAWLSDGNSSASSRLIHNLGPYKLINNALLVANNWSDLTDGSLLSPITLTENREFMDLVHGQKLVWTDTLANGDISSTDTRFNCNNWTSNASTLNGNAGVVGSNASTWTTGYGGNCSADWHLYCVEQVGNIITSPVPTSTPTPSSSSTPGYVTINYPQPEAGWNLIGVSVESPAVQNYNAVSLLSDSGCVEVDVWNNSSQGWNRYGSGAILPSYLNIQGGKSYMMKCGSSGRKAFSIAGTPVNTLPTLSPGWNMAAVPYNSSYSNVSSFVNDFDSSIKSNIKEVDRYEAGGWDSYLTNLTVNNFPITKDRGYFIKYQPNSTTVIAALSLPDSSPAPVATPGDGNGDGKINLIDLSILLSDFNKTNGFRMGIDMNGDGKINSFDFSLMRTLLIQKGVIKS